MDTNLYGTRLQDLDVASCHCDQALMRANYKLPRLFLTAPLSLGVPLTATSEQYNYLVNVLRMDENSELLVFNGRDGEWIAKLAVPARKKLTITPVELTRAQPPRSDLVFLFAPLKAGRLDYLVQKAVEMGAGSIWPVLTQHTQVQRIGIDRLQANVIEAAEQCGILSVPKVADPEKLDTLLENWDPKRRIIFCDEDASTHNPVARLGSIQEKRLAVLIGPEGGFSDTERTLLRSLAFVTPIPLGPRILRADTAAVAALAVVQAIIGDWR